MIKSVLAELAARSLLIFHDGKNQVWTKSARP